MIEIRSITEEDVPRVIELYRAVYEESFPIQDFYDARWIKKGVFDDDICWLLAERKGIVGPEVIGWARFARACSW